MNKKGKIDGRIYDVVTPEEYIDNRILYDPSYTAIENNGILYPVKRKMSNSTGFYVQGPVAFYVDPAPQDVEQYSSTNIIDFQNVKGMKEVIEKSASLRDLEREVLTSPDNIFIPKIGPNDTPEMVGFKQAVTAKHMDIDKYEPRFGSNYNNDKRLFNKDSITMGKMKSLADKLDIKVTVIFEDKSPDVPNPIGRVITVELNGNGSDEDEQ